MIGYSIFQYIPLLLFRSETSDPLSAPVEVKTPAAEKTVHVIDEKAEVNFTFANLLNP